LAYSLEVYTIEVYTISWQCIGRVGQHLNAKLLTCRARLEEHLERLPFLLPSAAKDALSGEGI
jgi:hypothetical protein